MESKNKPGYTHVNLEFTVNLHLDISESDNSDNIGTLLGELSTGNTSLLQEFRNALAEKTGNTSVELETVSVRMWAGRNQLNDHLVFSVKEDE
jgi:hypothetical protein